MTVHVLVCNVERRTVGGARESQLPEMKHQREREREREREERGA